MDHFELAILGGLPQVVQDEVRLFGTEAKNHRVVQDAGLFTLVEQLPQLAEALRDPWLLPLRDREHHLAAAELQPTVMLLQERRITRRHSPAKQWTDRFNRGCVRAGAQLLGRLFSEVLAVKAVNRVSKGGDRLRHIISQFHGSLLDREHTGHRSHPPAELVPGRQPRSRLEDARRGQADPERRAV